MKTLVIDKSKWLRGGNLGITGSWLLEPDCTDDFGEETVGTGMMCCLGFYCRDQGLTEDDIRGYAAPSDLDVDTDPIDALVELGVDTDICEELMEVNDDDLITDEKRQRELRKLFKKIGVKVSFRKGAG